MAVYLFTFHAYRSWREDNSRGYVQRGKAGVQEPNERLAKHRAKIANHEPVGFDDGQKRVLVDGVLDICSQRDWRVHGAVATPSHVHALVSWKKNGLLADGLSTTLKRLLGMLLSDHKGSKGNRWFSRGCDRKAVRDQKHFDHLVTEYLPDHVKEGGVIWRENG